MSCYSTSCYRSEESTQNRKVKCVTISETSYMLCYHDDMPQADLHYSKSDYFRFRQDALKTACTIRDSIKANQGSDTETTKVMRYIESWKRLPHLLEEYEIAHEEVVGIEHLVIGKKMVNVRMALRHSYVKMLFKEQDRQEEFGYYDPSMLADTAKQFSKISSSIAHSRAKHVAN
eukprot:CAMPEP_0201981578 /NCGR_PEP_ID=MMETSP0904-20121228/73977_1 /ASSEMBLY_ACC=CAM_ASM_000553 /TAXON_ID=420261 /ORGANISM="Thalassiosira antarctica, Strain CCMP982" /LENGTH=174 /DNA_ID=CAMNT_0048534179 /DNA_START=49 /DNA_END=573 /DNA_ORIENTATION=-